jgi:hypothetical protein
MSARLDNLKGRAVIDFTYSVSPCNETILLMWSVTCLIICNTVCCSGIVDVSGSNTSEVINAEVYIMSNECLLFSMRLAVSLGGGVSPRGETLYKRKYYSVLFQGIS